MSHGLDQELTNAEGVLTLLALRGIGPQAVWKLTERFKRVGEVVDAGDDQLHGLVTGQGRASLRDRRAVEEAQVEATRQVEAARRRGVAVLAPRSEDYPHWLRLASDRPPVLYALGHLKRGERYVACIGTREPTAFGKKATQGITEALVGGGWSIVSGLALGVDTVAHRAALDARGHTVAVLANGLDTVYPRANERLAAEILERGGALVSEQPLGTPVIPRNLVQRDRIQSGMSAGTVVNQTDIRGGSMHTVRFTLMQGRKLFAPVPGGEHAREAKSQGILALVSLTGPELARRLDLDERSDYAALLRQMRHTPAFGIRSREDYPVMVEQLEQLAGAPCGRPVLKEQLGLLLGE